MYKKLLLSIFLLLQITLVFTRKKNKQNQNEEEQEIKSKSQIKYEELIESQKNSETGIVTFQTPEEYQKYVEQSPRDYTIILYFTSNNCNICNSMEAEFEKVAQFYELQGMSEQKINESNGKEQVPVIFARMVFSDIFKDTFKKLEFSSVPNLVVYTTEYLNASNKESKRKYMQANKWFISHTDGHVTSHKILEYINQRTANDVQFVVSLSEKLMNLVYFIGFLLIVGFLIVIFYDVLINPKTWLVVSLIIYVICCSGFIYNYLHDVPLVQNGEWYSTQQRVQYGLEGYVMSICIGIAGIILISWNVAHKYIDDSPLLVRMLYISLFMGAVLVIWFIEDIYRKKGWYNPLFHPPSTYVKGSYLKDQGNSI